MERMKKCLMYLSFILIAFTSARTVSYGETLSIPVSSSESYVENAISALYKQIDFGKSARLSYDVFNKACKGYINLRRAGKLNGQKEIISICDFNLPSTENRLWVIDLASKKVLFNTYVAHGQGSGDNYANHFSNKDNTHESSLGFYVTGDIYSGKHGTSLRLVGLDQGFNDAALDRGIVVHAADYVTGQYVSQRHRLGRSWGCPAVPPKLSMPIINTIKDNTCLFIYYPDSKYLSQGYWLNKKLNA
jgi:hypothetical protein